MTESEKIKRLAMKVMGQHPGALEMAKDGTWNPFKDWNDAGIWQRSITLRM